MPRSNRPRGRKPEVEDDGLERLLTGWHRTEVKHGTSWSVQPVSGERAVKSYSCPGCNGEIVPGTAHLVAWRTDGVLGPEADLAARRHWHSHCWRIA